MRIKRDEYLSVLPGVILAGLSAVLFSAARWLERFDDNRPDLGGD